MFVDTNVFYPVRLADLVLSCASDGLFDLCVSDDLGEEVERVLIEHKGLPVEKARTFWAAVEATANSRLKRAEYFPVREHLDGPDHDDLWHLAAAITVEADVILTSNTSDFEKAQVPDTLTCVSILGPDDFFVQLINDGLGTDVAATIRRMSARLKRPPRTPTEIIDGLEHIGLIETAALLRNP